MASGFEITLPCSTVVAGVPIPVSIRLYHLNQSLTYGGLIEGVPHDKMNDRLIDGAIRDAKTTFGKAEPFLIAPKQEPLDIGRDYPFGKPAALPSVKCIAFFLCLFPTPKGNCGDFSSMTVVWFQEEFAMPIDGEVCEKIRAIDWLNLATNSEW
jgi:hypothetical protein